MSSSITVANIIAICTCTRLRPAATASPTVQLVFGKVRMLIIKETANGLMLQSCNSLHEINTEKTRARNIQINVEEKFKENQRGNFQAINSIQ